MTTEHDDEQQEEPQPDLLADMRTVAERTAEQYGVNSPAHRFTLEAARIVERAPGTKATPQLTAKEIVDEVERRRSEGD